MFLDSADCERQDGRFDIIVANPIASITTIGNTSTVWQQDTDQSQENALKNQNINNISGKYWELKYLV